MESQMAKRTKPEAKKSAAKKIDAKQPVAKQPEVKQPEPEPKVERQIEEKQPEVKPSPLHVCVAENSVMSPRNNFSRRFGRGTIIDLNQEIAPGVTLRSLVRVNCFRALQGDQR
jgi:hypothetical protein